MRVNWVQGYQKEGSYSSQKGQEATQRKGFARTAVRPCKICTQEMHRVGVHASAKCFSALTLLELVFPYGYHTTITENSVPFLGLKETKQKQLRQRENDIFPTVTLRVMVSLSSPTTSPWEAGNPRDKLSAWKRITGSQLAQSKVMGMYLFISSWAAVHSCLSPARHNHSGHHPVKYKGNGFTEAAQLIQGNLHNKSFMTPGRNPTHRLCSPSQGSNPSVALTWAQ